MSASKYAHAATVETGSETRDNARWERRRSVGFKKAEQALTLGELCEECARVCRRRRRKRARGSSEKRPKNPGTARTEETPAGEKDIGERQIVGVFPVTRVPMSPGIAAPRTTLSLLTAFLSVCSPASCHKRLSPSSVWFRRLAEEAQERAGRRKSQKEENAGRRRTRAVTRGQRGARAET